MKVEPIVFILFLSSFFFQCFAQTNTNSQENFYFCSDRSGNWEIYVSKKGEVKQLTNDKQFDSWWSRVSPDGKEIVFYRSPKNKRKKIGGGNNNYKQASLWKINSDGKNEREIIPKGESGSTAQGVADWSPDGKRLVMAMEIKKRWNLYITDANGKNLTRVSKRKSIYLDPSFSPDGKRIVYVAFPPNTKGTNLKHLEVYTSKIDGSDEQRLTFDKFRDHDPYWSPDGKEIAFETMMKKKLIILGEWAIRSVNVETNAIRTIIDDGNINTLPRWSKDSQTIFFHRFEYKKPNKFHLVKINRDGSNLTKLTNGGKKYDDSDIDPVW